STAGTATRASTTSSGTCATCASRASTRARARFSASSSRGTSSAAEPKRTPRCAEGLRTRPSAFSHQGRGERGRGTGRGQARGRRRDASGASDGRCGLLEREGLFVEGSAEDGAVDLGVLRERAQIVERTDAARSENRQNRKSVV